MADPTDVNALGMSDDDFLNADPTSFEDPDDAGEADAPDEDSQDPVEDPAAKEDDEDTEDAPDADDADDLEDDKDAQQNKDPEKDSDDEGTDEADKDADKNQDKDSEEDPEKAKDEKAPDELSTEQYAEVGRQIMSEFKANGTMLKVKSAEDAIQLMQMGANYHKKMSGLKPSLKTLKLLENNGLMDHDKLNFLIDLSQKKPEAITKLLKDSKIDPMDIDLEAESNYKPNNRTVNDTELVLDEVLESISDSPSYNKTLTVLGDEWDDVSRGAISQDPQIIRTINAHMENGIFDQVANAVAYERSLGKLTGVSDLEAYQRIGTHMHENNLFKNANVKPAPAKPARQEPQPQQNSANEAKAAERKQRKQAASPSRQRQAPAKGNENYDPLAMSDEEFAKLNNISL